LERKLSIKILITLSTEILKFVAKAATVFLSSFLSRSLVDFLQGLATSLSLVEENPPTSHERVSEQF
jgi:hypothetical protein